MTADLIRMARRTGITAREAVALSGLTDQYTLGEIYKSKVDDIPLPQPKTGGFEMLMAHYTRATGYRLHLHGMFRHEQQRFALCEPGLAAVAATTVVPKDSLAGTSTSLIERLVRVVTAVKSVSWGPAGGQIVPPPLYAECQWEMAVIGREEQDIAVRWVGGGFSIYTIKAKEEIFPGYYAIAEHFMSTFVFPQVPPPTPEEERKPAKKARSVPIIPSVGPTK